MRKQELTITIRNVPARVVSGLKAMANQHHQSMEQEVRNLLEEAVSDRASLLAQLETGWERQTRRPGKAEVDAWIETGRSKSTPRRTTRR
jgi:plasmid stability protein